jgi:hypothetical protein
MPEKNCFREYGIIIGQNLLGEWVLLLWENRTKELPLRKYTAEEVEAFLRDDELDAKAAQIAARAESIVAATTGALKSDMLALSAEEERRAAEEEIAEDVMKRVGGT